LVPPLGRRYSLTLTRWFDTGPPSIVRAPLPRRLLIYSWAPANRGTGTPADASFGSSVGAACCLLLLLSCAWSVLLPSATPPPPPKPPRLCMTWATSSPSPTSGTVTAAVRGYHLLTSSSPFFFSFFLLLPRPPPPHPPQQIHTQHNTTRSSDSEDAYRRAFGRAYLLPYYFVALVATQPSKRHATCLHNRIDKFTLRRSPM